MRGLWCVRYWWHVPQQPLCCGIERQHCLANVVTVGPCLDDGAFGAVVVCEPGVLFVSVTCENSINFCGGEGRNVSEHSPSVDFFLEC